MVVKNRLFFRNDFIILIFFILIEDYTIYNGVFKQFISMDH